MKAADLTKVQELFSKDNVISYGSTVMSRLNSGVTAKLSSIMEKTAKNKDALEQFGISVDRKGRMKIDEEAFKKSDMSQVQKFFDEYGSSMKTNVSLVDYYMRTQADASHGYTADGTYRTQGSYGYDFGV